ncbi:MAG: hypothetical protein ACYC3I_16050 [Gemmataceae bacterium]
MDEGKIPCRTVGKYRRVRFDDLMAYKRKDDEARARILDVHGSRRRTSGDSGRPCSSGPYTSRPKRWLKARAPRGDKWQQSGMSWSGSQARASRIGAWFSTLKDRK